MASRGVGTRGVNGGRNTVCGRNRGLVAGDTHNSGDKTVYTPIHAVRSIGMALVSGGFPLVWFLPQ